MSCIQQVDRNSFSNHLRPEALVLTSCLTFGHCLQYYFHLLITIVYCAGRDGAGYRDQRWTVLNYWSVQYNTARHQPSVFFTLDQLL